MNRWMHKKLFPVTPKEGKKGATGYMAFPVAIDIAHRKVMFGYELPEDSIWDADGTPEQFGISTRCAALALAEAYRVIEWKVDPATLHYHVKIDRKKFISFRGGSMARNVAVFLEWDAWNRLALPEEWRVSIVEGWGYRCTGKALERIVEDAGLTLKT